MNKSYDYVLQQNQYDCGIASLINVLMYYGIKPSREKLINNMPKRNGGYTAYDIIKMSKKYGFDAYGIKTDITKIKDFPVIAHTIKDKNMFHFIVIYEKNKNYLKILDPAEGIKKITFEEFNKITTNIFLIFTGIKKKKITNEKFKKELKSILKNNKQVIFITLLLSIIFVILSLIFNYYLKLILTYQNNVSLIISISIIFLFISIFKTTINYIKNRLILRLSLKIDKELTSKITNHILNLPYEYFTKKTTGELVTTLEDVENFKEIITKIFILCSVDLLLIIIVIIYTSMLNIYIGLILSLLLIILVKITNKYKYIFNDSYLKYKNSKISYTSSLINYITSFETIKNLNIAKNIDRLLKNKYCKLNIEEKNYNKKFYNYNFITSGMTDIFYIIVIFLFSYISIINKINILDIVLFSSIFYMMIDLVNNINESISLYKVYQTSTDRVLDLLDVKKEELKSTNYLSINEIILKDVSYKKDDITILKNINLKIKKGEKIFITGKSGIGKSTLIKLLLRYFNITGGEILIDNISWDTYDLSFIRDNITYIGQNEELFTGTILDNLKLVSSDEDKIKEIASLTLLDQVLENNNIDYNYLIEESGYNLSGGERKKIILTRGLLKFNNVLVLDEVFNEISESEEKEILNNLFSKYYDKTIIVISHHDKNINLFDKKYRLEREGDLVEIK